MNFRFTKEQEEFRQELRKFLVEETPPDFAKYMYGTMDVAANDEVSELSSKIAPKLAEKGWLTSSWPKEWFGRGASCTEKLIMAEELGYCGVPARDMYSIGMVGPMLIEWGTEEQKKQHLPSIARGEVLWCQGFSEPDAGSDMGACKTTAVWNGKEYVVNGQKTWTSQAHRAKWIFFLAKTDPEAPKYRNLTIFIAPLDTPGITIKPIISMDGTHHFSDVFFDDVRIPKENVLGEVNKGWAVAMALMNYDRTLMEPLGQIKRLIEVMVEYVNRTGDSKNQVVRQKLAQLAIETEVCHLLAYKIAAAEDAKLPIVNEASMSKIMNAELMRHATGIATEIVGLGSQLTEDETDAPCLGRLGHLHFDSIANAFGAGTIEIQKNTIARFGLGLPREPRG